MDNEDILNDLIDLKNKINNIIKKIKKEDKNKQSEENKYGCIIKLFEDVNNDYHKNVNNTFNEIVYYYNIYKERDPEFENKKKLDKEKIKDYVNDIIEGKIKYKKNERQNEGIINAKSTKNRYKNRIERSIQLYNKYGKTLEKVYFSLDDMSRIYNYNWKEWQFYIDDFIENNVNIKE